MLKYTTMYPSFGKEVKGKHSLNINISDCGLNCDGCHMPELREDVGLELTVEAIKSRLWLYDAVCFMGGANKPEELILLLRELPGVYVCVYTGYATIDEGVKAYCDAYKTGPYSGAPITQQGSNQRYYRRENGVFVDRTDLFQGGGKCGPM